MQQQLGEMQRSVQKEGEEVLQIQKQKYPAACVTPIAGCLPAARGHHMKQISTLSPMEEPTGVQVNATH